MFKVLERDGRTVPMICCDICEVWIDDVGLAAAVFGSPRNNGDVQEMWMVHKGGCLDKAEAQLRADGNALAGRNWASTCRMLCITEV